MRKGCEASKPGDSDDLPRPPLHTNNGLSSRPCYKAGCHNAASTHQQAALGDAGAHSGEALGALQELHNLRATDKRGVSKFNSRAKGRERYTLAGASPTPHLLAPPSDCCSLPSVPPFIPAAPNRKLPPHPIPSHPTLSASPLQSFGSPPTPPPPLLTQHHIPSTTPRYTRHRNNIRTVTPPHA